MKSSSLRIAVINPPFLGRYSRSQRSPGVIRSGTLYYPYWLAHATAVLQQDGFDCLLLDCPAAQMTLPLLLERLSAYRPDLVVLDTSTASSESDAGVAEAIHRQLPGARTCLVGTHVTALWEETLQQYPGVDFVAVGEYDYTIRDLARALSSKEFASVLGLAFRDEDGKPILSGIRPVLANVDDLPWIAPVYKKFLDPKHYSFSLASHPMVMLIGGRGCVAKCTYCVLPQTMHGHSYRTRRPESIVGEMKWIQENMPEVKEIVFEDDTFTGDKAFARRVAALVESEGVRLPWFANVRSSLDRETLALLKRSGFRCCAVGFESGDDLLLKNMWKGQTVSMQKRFMEDCKSLGILVHGCFMVGFPGETPGTMARTLKLAMELDPDSAQFYPVMPFPGTAYYRWAKENGYLATEKFSEWLHADGKHRCVVNLPGLTPQAIESFCNRAYLIFYFRPKYLWFKVRQSVTHWREGVRSIVSFGSFLYDLVTRRMKKNPGLIVEKKTAEDSWYGLHKMPQGRMLALEET